MKPVNARGEPDSPQIRFYGEDPLVLLHWAIWRLMNEVGREDFAIFCESLPKDIRDGHYDESPYCTCDHDAVVNQRGET